MKINHEYILNNYKATMLTQEIVMIEDFITVEEQEVVLAKIALLDNQDWENFYLDGIKEQARQYYNTEDYQKLIDDGIIGINPGNIDKVARIPIEDLSAKWFDNMAKFFIIEGKKIEQPDIFSIIVRRYTGTSFDYHIDSRGFDGKADQNVYYTVVLYFNDDYAGGELDFPDLNICIKPPSRSLVIFNSGPDYVHGVKEIGEGPTRYVATCFMRE